MSITNALGIAISGMQYNQAGLGNVSHNIVNANTPGYARQVIQAGAASYNGLGAGVEISGITRIVDSYLQNRTLDGISDADFATTKRSYMDNIEGIFTNASAQGSLQDLSNGFFGAMAQLSNSPADSALRRNAMQSGVLLADTIRDMNGDLDSLQTRLDNEVTNELNTLNTALKRIYDLNKEIQLQDATSSINGGNTNDLQDSRDAQVEEMAKRLGLNVSKSSNGSYRILTENGRRLVDENSYVQFARSAGAGAFSDIVSQAVKVDGSLDPFAVILDTDSLTTGRIKSLVDLRDDVIPDLLAELDAFTSNLKTEVNKVHSRGSSFPPVNTLTSAATSSTLTATTSNLFTTLSSSLAGATFNASVVNAAGTVISTTVGSTPITIPGTGPFSLADLQVLINTNSQLGNVALSNTSTSPAVLGITDISTDGTLPSATYTIRRISATTVELWNAANTAQIASTNTVTIVQPSVGTQTLNFGQGLVVTTNSTLDISGTANGAAAGTLTLGNTSGVTATATTDSSGKPIIRLQTQTAGQYVVLSNVSGDALGILGMNTFFSGTDSNDIAVKSSIANNPELIAVARMRSDGGLSNLDSQNILAVAQVADTTFSFSAAGSLGAQSATISGYSGQITGSLAININDAKDRENFTDNVLNQIQQLRGTISGVNLNEELSQMLVFQNGFQAASRIISVVDQLLETLIGLGR